MRIIAILTLLFSSTSSKIHNDIFTEDLFIKPLNNEQLYAHFRFTTKWDVDSTKDDLFQTRLFSRALSEIIVRFNIQELHITLTAGLWRYETWGYPADDAAPGAEVWAWFKNTTEDVDKNWTDLTNFLSGLICASLNQMDARNSIVPDISFKPQGVVLDNVNSSYLRYSSLPREIVCTENLTPWKKLLPCDSKMGLASLLNAGNIHNTRYHSLGIHLKPICRDVSCEETSLLLHQTVDLVYDYLIMRTRNWSLRSLFGQGILNSCPLASSSSIYVDVSKNFTTNRFKLSPEPEFFTSKRGGDDKLLGKYKVVDGKPMNIGVNYIDQPNYEVNIPPVIYASQYKIGYGQQRGGLVNKIYNNHWGSLEVVLLQNIPWYVPIYLHTLKIISNNQHLKPLKMIYKPGQPREKPHNLEIVLKLPPKSSTSISIDFEYMFLKWQEYPPDANHGFYISSSIISAWLPLARNYTGLPQDAITFSDSFNASRSGYLVQIRTESIVITLPTPDFSMPYNVICLACTVVALAFGPLHNITTKRLILVVKKSSPFWRFLDFTSSKKKNGNNENVDNLDKKNE
nr:GPI transamidase component PIG-T [Onthophagus taurus]XP_022907426.1 GPI transamidase component PIG-T [Onthophagus taurus]